MTRATLADAVFLCLHALLGAQVPISAKREKATQTQRLAQQLEAPN